MIGRPAPGKLTVVTSTESAAELAHHNFVDFARRSAHWSGERGAVEERDGIVLYATGTDFPAVCNGVLRTGDDLTGQSLSGTQIVEIADRWFADRGKGYTVWVREIDGVDDDLAKAAEQAGLLAVLDEPQMICTTRLGPSLLPDGVELRWVTTAAEMHQFAAVNGEAYATYGMPEATVGEMLLDPVAFTAEGVHPVLAYRDGEPVASAQLVMSGEVGGVYWVATVDSARRIGLGEAVTRAVTDRGFDLGASSIGLQASPMGEPIYQRLGYETIYRYTGWVRFVG
jgi:hypothetical protein